MLFNSKMRKTGDRVRMEFFRKHQKTIVFIIAVTFMAWTFGMMLLPVFIK